MKETVFTKIARKEVQAFIIDETDEFMAFLDNQPSVYAQALVIPKEWHDSYVFRNDAEFLARFMEYVKKVALLIDKKIGTERCIVMFEGYGVDHLHAKLYPVSSAEEAFNLNTRDKTKLTDEVGEEIVAKILR
jgi:diadenosine tetraphosphate (Ap4A) HIT family hydrolase